MEYSDGGENGPSWSICYTAAGEVDVVTRFADLAGTTKAGTIQYSHDAAGRVTGIEHLSGSGGLLADYDYAYDDAGRLISKTEDSVVTLFAYDDAGQLTADGAASFTYDGSGNRTTTGSVTAAGNRLSSDGTWSYTHDAAGQLVKKSQGASAETWTYGYDHRGQMTWAEKRATDGGTLVVRVFASANPSWDSRTTCGSDDPPDNPRCHRYRTWSIPHHISPAPQ